MTTHHDITYFDSINPNIIVNSKDKIHSYVIEKEQATFLKLSFSKIILPKHSYVEFQYGDSAIRREFFHNASKAMIIIPDKRVNIRVVLGRLPNSDDRFSFELDSVESHDDSVLRSDNSSPYMCFAGTEMADHALAVAVTGMSRWGACSLIGTENHLLTNIDVVNSEDYLEHSEVWLNYFNQSCDPDSPINEPVRLQLGRVLAMNHGIGPNHGYVLLTLDEFDYVNSHVKTLFGGLKICEENPSVGEKLYIPMYPSDPLGTMSIAENAKVAFLVQGGDAIIYKGVSLYDVFAAPVISSENHQIVGVHRRYHHDENLAISSEALTDKLGSLIGDSNQSVIGLGKVKSFNLELTPFDIRGHLIPVDLSNKGVILPFDTVSITDYDSYSLIKVDAIDLLTHDVFPLTFKASLIDKRVVTNINDNSINGKAFLQIYDFDLEPDTARLIKFWLAFKVNNATSNLENYLIRVVLDYYNPLDVPFNMETVNDKTVVLDLNILKRSVLEQSSVSFTIRENDHYGFIALNNGQGPVDLVCNNSDKQYSEVKVLLKNASGDKILVNLRGTRQTASATNIMNSVNKCCSADEFSRLNLSFHPEDNENLIYDEDTIYRGIIPLQARDGFSDAEPQDILVNVSLTGLSCDCGSEEPKLI